MVAQSIEQLKQNWTDKYVVVDGQRPELARFRDVVGVVKTVNMSGRALVEFLDYHINIGWYDIDLDFLKIVDKPLPKVEKPKADKTPAAKAPAGEAASAAGAKPKPAAKPAAGGKQSVADILAAARGGKAPAKTEAAGEAAAAPAKAKPAAKPAADRSKMSVADMLAAARAGGAASATNVPAEAAPAEEEEAAEPEAAPVAAKPKAAPAAKSGEKIDKSKMSIDDMCNWCREHDTK